MDKKKVSEIILSIFVAMIFISSYAIFTNAGGGQQTTTTTTTAPQTVYGTGYANATLLGYNTTLSIYSACNYTYANVSAALSKLERNNSIFSYYYVGNSTIVDPGKMNTTSVYSYMQRFQSGNCLSFYAPALIMLPSEINLRIELRNYTVVLPEKLRTQSMDLLLRHNSTSSIRVRIAALVETNGTIYSINATEAA
jgi:hypothetical protein